MKLKNKLMNLAKNFSYISVTFDIWSDRRMRGYLGITFHYIHSETAKLQSHFPNIMTEFNIHDKVVRVVSDNALNMRKAFTLSLAVTSHEAVTTVGGAGEDHAPNTQEVDSDDEVLTLDMLELEETLDVAVAGMFTGAGQDINTWVATTMHFITLFVMD